MENKITIKCNERGRCPKCGEEIDYYESEFCGDSVYFNWYCPHCSLQGREWYDLRFEGQDIFTENSTIDVNQYCDPDRELDEDAEVEVEQPSDPE